MDVKISPTKDVRILGLDERSVENIFWCAFSYRLERVFWVDGYLLCLEVYDRAFDYEVKKGFFPISQVCYTGFPKYVKVYEIEKGIQMPIVNVSDMRLYRAIVKTIQKTKENK